MNDAPSLSLPRHLVSSPKLTKQCHMAYGYIIDWEIVQQCGEMLWNMPEAREGLVREHLAQLCQAHEHTMLVTLAQDMPSTCKI